MLIYNSDVISIDNHQRSLIQSDGVKRVTSVPRQKYKLNRQNIIFLRSLGLKVKTDRRRRRRKKTA